MDKFNTNKSDKTGFTQKTGDAIERVGQKVSEMGATKIGKKIYDAGDAIEHSRDDKRK